MMLRLRCSSVHGYQVYHMLHLCDVVRFSSSLSNQPIAPPKYRFCHYCPGFPLPYNLIHFNTPSSPSSTSSSSSICTSMPSASGLAFVVPGTFSAHAQIFFPSAYCDIAGDSPSVHCRMASYCTSVNIYV